MTSNIGRVDVMEGGSDESKNISYYVRDDVHDDRDCGIFAEAQVRVFAQFLQALIW